MTNDKSFNRDEWLAEQLDTNVVERDGALYWISSGNAVPVDCFTDAGRPIPPRQREAVSEQASKAIAAYRAMRAEHGYSAEERYEMRAAFGSEPVVDILTGKKVQ